MIRVNLLPFRLERKKENIRRQVSVFFLSIIFGLLVLFWFTSGIDDKIEDTRRETEFVKSQITKYKAKADKVTAIKKKLKILEKKLEVVESLKGKRTEQLELLEIIPELVIKDRMWLNSLKADQKSVSIKGTAFDNPTIADFMKNLEATAHFSKINLKQSKITKVNKAVMLKSFDLVCLKKSSAVAKPNGAKKGKKG